MHPGLVVMVAAYLVLVLLLFRWAHDPADDRAAWRCYRRAVRAGERAARRRRRRG